MDAPMAPVDRTELKREIKQELTREAKRKKAAAAGGCLFVILLVFGIPTFWVLSLFAKSGFVEVPVLSKQLFVASTPERQVLPLGGSTSDSVVRVIGTRSEFDPHTSLLTFTAKEAELTTLLQHGIWEASPGALPFPIRIGQVAVDRDSVEVFLIVPRGRHETTVLARFKPVVTIDGRIEVEASSLRIGSLDVPPSFAGALMKAYGGFIIDALSKEIAKVGLLVDIRPVDRQLKFLIKPNGL